MPATDDLSARLLQAAAEVFAERGYDKAGVAEIARRAGATTGAIYSRYPSKADLLLAAIDPQAMDELDALFADHRFEGRMEDILRTAGTHLVKNACDVGDTGESMLLEAFAAARRHPDVAGVLRARVAERQGRLREIIEAAKADGGISEDLETESLVTFCHAIGFGFVLLDALDLPLPAPGPWEQLISHLVAALASSGSGPGATDLDRSNSSQPHTTRGNP